MVKHFQSLIFLKAHLLLKYQILLTFLSKIQKIITISMLVPGPAQLF